MELPNLDKKSRSNLDELVEMLRGPAPCYLYVGSGLSCLCGLACWKDLVTKCTEAYQQHPNHCPDTYQELVRAGQERTLDVFEVLLRDCYCGREALAEVLRREYVTDKHHKCHEMLLGLPFVGYVTTNYDRCLENAARHCEGGGDLRDRRWFGYTASARQNGDGFSTENLFDGERFLLHLHGSVESDGNCNIDAIVLARSQYTEFYQRQDVRDTWYRLAKANLLIAGVGRNDPYVENQIATFRRTASGEALSKRGNWWWITRINEGRIPLHNMEAMNGIRLIGYEGDLGKGLEAIVEYIHAAVTPRMGDEVVDGTEEG